MGDYAKKVLDTYFPTHGNNTEARRNEKPTVEFKPTAKDAPIGMGIADQGRRSILDRERQLKDIDKDIQKY